MIVETPKPVNAALQTLSSRFLAFALIVFAVAVLGAGYIVADAINHQSAAQVAATQTASQRATLASQNAAQNVAQAQIAAQQSADSNALTRQLLDQQAQANNTWRQTLPPG